ncbi:MULTISPECIES: hypothetical protein [unclassified Rhizobium]|uniref:hypothetical protein n=1 Tax=unclassified Rhizobium TaxID=2613769 RepID=UPI0015CA121B|nr:MULTISPECIES: hypothetical protein [unclassified Rhizobium]MDH7809541.1 hypothetical protein [Rhizobium sp. AN67]MDQ4408783.1 hypothetical protein [Rhizobium sp. AN63]
MLTAPAFSHAEKENWRRAYRGPSRSPVLQEPGAHATALPSSTLAAVPVHGHTIGP